MFTDFINVGMWTLFVTSSALATAHLGRNLGALVLSQAGLSASAGLMFSWAFHWTSSPWLSLALALVGSTILGAVHLPLLLYLGKDMTVIVTVIVQILIQEFWLAAPAITGGSGGVLLTSRWWIPPTGLLAPVALVIVWRFFLRPPSHANTFDWPCLRHLGPHAGAFGVAVTRHYLTGFALLGLTCGLVGVAATQLVGNLAIQAWGLPWSITLLLIALLAYESPFAIIVLLAAVYSVLRVVFRQSVVASVLTGHLFELAFPLVLIGIYAIRLSRLEGRSKPDSVL